MNIITDDRKKMVDIGGSDILYALYSTAYIRIEDNKKTCVEKALDFLETGSCAKGLLETAKQVNLIRDMLSQVSPDKMVYDKNDIKKKAPWGNNISPVITSCANYFTTADGKDLFSELVEILVYAHYTGNSVKSI